MLASLLTGEELPAKARELIVARGKATRSSPRRWCAR